MAPAIASQRAEAAFWAALRRRGSLTRRILAVNLVALLLSGGSIFYLDAFRSRLIAERLAQAQEAARVIGAIIARAPPDAHARIVDAAGRASGDRVRLYDAKGNVVTDSWQTGPRSFRLRDPARDGWRFRAARWLDAIVDRVVRARIPAPFIDYGRLPADRWSELRCVIAAGPGTGCVAERLAPDRTPVLSAAYALQSRPARYLLTVRDARDAIDLVRAERLRLFLIVLTALALSVALSVFLARTIVAPVRGLTRAAIRVRAGRSRDVVVPRLPGRTDEIGLLARAVSDMAGALRNRIDATERFAADVAHELKNPLASLASAVETMQRVDAPGSRAQLLAIVADDVRRLDRLITDIAALSRLDAQLSRSAFTTFDLGEAVARQVDERRSRAPHGDGDPRIAYARPGRGTAIVEGDHERLARAIGNLLDNAVSFSPPGGVIRVAVALRDGQVVVSVDDDGPGVPDSARDAIFERFHTDRPPDASGGHSGLGLAIAQTIVVGHGGTISVGDREDGRGGAHFAIALPLAMAAP